MVLIRKTLYCCILVGIAVAQNAQAQYIPKEFQHFYDFEKNNIMFLLPNNSSYEFEGLSNYYGIQSVSDEAGLRRSILKSGIKQKYVEEVISAITSGKSVELASGVTTEFYSEEKTMKVAVPAKYLDEGVIESRYTDIEPDSSALIVGNHIFASYYGEKTSTTLNTDVTVGFGNGYISSDMTLSGGSSQDASIEANSAYYEHNIDSASLRIGYDSYGVGKDNSTSNLDFSNTRDNYYISVSSSDNLYVSDNEDSKQIYFDIKGSGTVDVVRDGRTVYTQSFLKGQHGISYKHLPRGNYNVELVIRADGYPEERVNRRVNNNVTRTSHAGFDYNLTLRNSEYSIGEGTNRFAKDHLMYGDVSFTKSLFHDSFMVGVNSQSDGEDYGVGVLVNYVSDWVDASSYYNQIKEGSFYDGSVSVAGFNLDYQKFGGSKGKSANKISPLLLAVYGAEAFDQTTISYSLPILSSNLSFYGSRVRYDDYGEKEGFESQNLAIDYNTTIFRNMQLNVGFTRTLNENAGQNVSVDNIYSANLTIPLGDNHSTYTSGVDSSSRSGQRLVNSLTYDDDEFDLLEGIESNGSASINNYIDGRQSEVSLSGRLNMSNQQFRSSTYANLSNNSNSNLSFNAESTTILTKGGIYQTKDNSKVYVVVESEEHGPNPHEGNKEFGVLDTQENSGYHTSIPIDAETSVVGLNEFSTYKFQVDSEISGYKSSKNNHDVKSEMFSYPGSVHKVANDVDPVVTFLSYFEDFNNKPLNDVKCIGDGCVSVGRVGDGIYSVSLVKNKPFKVASDGQFCFVELGDVASTRKMTKCFPKIETLDSGMQLVASGLGGEEDKVFYLGVLEDVIPDSILKASREAGIEYIQYDFANNVHLFAKTNDANLNGEGTLDIVNKHVLEDIQNYVRNRDANDFFAQSR